jgi:hypothetical protein
MIFAAAGGVSVPGYGFMKVIVYAPQHKDIPSLMTLAALLYVQREEQVGRERAP